MQNKWLKLLIVLSIILASGLTCAGQDKKTATAEVPAREEASAEGQLDINKIAILEGKTEDIRIKAASLILADDSEPTRKILLDIMKDEKNQNARVAVCKALSRSRTEKKEITKKTDFIDSLVSILVTSDDTAEVKMAAEAMLIFDYSQISNQLERTAGDKSSPLKARLNAIYALKLQPDMRATIQIIKLVDDKDKLVAAEAERTLLSLGIAYGKDEVARKEIIKELETTGKDKFLQERLIWQESNMDKLDARSRLWRERYLASLDRLYNPINDDAGKSRFLLEFLSDKENEVRLWSLNKVYQWWVGTQPATNLLVDLGPALIKLISDPDRDIRLKTAKLLSLISKLDTANALAEQYKIESDDEVKTELFVALGWSCYYATLPNASIKVSPDLRKQTLKWAKGYLSDKDSQKVLKGAEVIKKLLEQDGLTDSEVDEYLGLISKKYLEQTPASEDGLCAELLGTMAGLCGQSVSREKAAAIYRPLFDEALNSQSDLMIQKAVDGLISIDKNAALKKLREGFTNSKLPQVRAKLIELADAVGGKEDLVWLSDKVANTPESKPAWQAMLKIFKRSDTETIAQWFKQLRDKIADNKLTDEQMLAFLETAEGKIAAEKNPKLLPDIQKEMARLYKQRADYERAAKYYGILLKSNPPLSEQEKDTYMAQLLDVYLRWKNIESAKQLITNRLLSSDIDSNSPLISTVTNYFGGQDNKTDPNILLGPLSRLALKENRPLWNAQLKKWQQSFATIPDPNKTEPNSDPNKTDPNAH
jgi:hypothetical protein